MSTSGAHFVQPLLRGYHCSAWNRIAGPAWCSREDFTVIQKLVSMEELDSEEMNCTHSTTAEDELCIVSTLDPEAL